MSAQDIFKAISDPTRRQILKLLHGGSRTAGQLADEFDVSKASMSHHFAVLKAADLIRSERRGRRGRDPRRATTGCEAAGPPCTARGDVARRA